jgi:hypothetical protein
MVIHGNYRQAVLMPVLGSSQIHDSCTTPLTMLRSSAVMIRAAAAPFSRVGAIWFEM